MENFKKHIAKENSSIKDVLKIIDGLGSDGTIFIVNQDEELIGSITDGDVRRAIINGIDPNDTIENVINRNPKYIRKGEYTLSKLVDYRKRDILIFPVLNKTDDRICNVVNLKKHRSYLPIDAVIMAGGKGERLRPLTETTPKPLLKVGDTPIIERNINRLAQYGIDDIVISVNYLGAQLEDYFGDGSQKGISINYVREDKPLGTLGSISLTDEFENDYVLIMNSDLLTNIDFESFFADFIESEADLSILSIPYKVDIPYAVFDLEDGKINGLKEKPRYTYYSNGGIYLIHKKNLQHIPKGVFYNATDLIEDIINKGGHVRSYPLVDYWLDIGNHDDFKKAQAEVNHIKF